MDGWMEGWMDGWMDGRMNKKMDECMYILLRHSGTRPFHFSLLPHLLLSLPISSKPSLHVYLTSDSGMVSTIMTSPLEGVPGSPQFGPDPTVE